MALYVADYYVRPTNGLDSNAGTSWGAAFKTLQKALDTAVAGKVIGCAAEAEEVLTAAVDDDTNSGSSAAGPIKIIGLNASGELDGTRYVINGNSAATNCILINGRSQKQYINIQLKNATDDGFLFATTLSVGIVLNNCIINNNGGDGIDCSIANCTLALLRTQLYSNGATGINQASALTTYLVRSSFYLNTSHGVSNNNLALITKSLIYKNTGNGLNHSTLLGVILENIIDGNAIGIVYTSVTFGKVLFNRITNNTTGIQVSSGTVYEDFNYFSGNGNKINITTGGTVPTGLSSVDMAADGYVNDVANNYALINGATPAEGRWVSLALDGTNTDYFCAGMGPNPDFPTAANVRDNDTVDGVTGTLSSNKILKSNATPGNWNDDNATAGNIKKDIAFGLASTGTLESTDPGVANVLTGTAYIIESVAKTGTLVQKDLTYEEEAARNTNPGAAHVETGVTYKILNADYTGTLTAYPVPTAPVLSASVISQTVVRLTWTPGILATSFQPKYSPDGISYTNFGSAITSGTVDVTGLTASTLYYFKVTATNDSGSTDSNVVLKTTDATTPPLTNIENKIKTLIESMTTAGGYYSNWGDCNEPDHAKKDAYPCAEVRLIPGEDNVDESGGTHSYAYDNVATFEIKVHEKLTTLVDNPDFSINAEHCKAADDLKRIFGRNPNLDGLCNSVMYRGSRREKIDNGNVIIPGDLLTTWRISYTQDREQPSLLSN